MSAAQTGLRIGDGKSAANPQASLARTINPAGDALETEADRIAAAVVANRDAGRHSFSRIAVNAVQRDDDKPKSDADKLKDAAAKVGEAFLKTEVGKKLVEAVKNLPLAKIGEDFIDTLPGKVIAGAAAAGVITTLAATHSELPLQIPEIPLDKLRPGLAVKLTWKGPVDKPTEAMITFSFTEQAEKKKDKSGASPYAAETARLAAENEKFRANTTYAPGSPQAEQDREDKENFNRAMAARLGKLPAMPDYGSQYPNLKVSAGPQLGSSPGFGYQPPSFRLLDQTLQLKPLGSVKAAEQAKKKDDAAAPVQRKSAGAGSASMAAPPVVEQALQAPGQPLDAATRSLLEPRFGFDFSSVRIHTDATAARSADAIQANAYTSGKDVVFASGKYAPGTQAGQKLLAHELTHVIQQQAGAGVVQRAPNDLASYPEAERESLKVNTPATGLPSDMKDRFTPLKSGNPGTTNSVGGPVEFGASVPTTPPILRVGLQGVGGWLIGQTNGLPLNSVTTLAIDLTPYGGANALYRFSYLTHTQKGKKPEDVLLIEQTAAVPAAPAKSTATAGKFKVRGAEFTLGAGWTDERYTVLLQALNLIPDTVLTEAAGISFKQTGAGTPDEAGKFERATDTITIHDNAFSVGAARFGSSESAVRAVAHEVGHALDSRRLEPAFKTFTAAGQTPAAQQTLLAVRSLSGIRHKAPTATEPNFTDQEVTKELKGNAFRSAAQQDRTALAATGSGLKGGVTDYGNTNWEELFAESFSLYTTDPGTLELIRPHTFQYFQSKFPLPAAASVAPATAVPAPPAKKP